MCQPLKQGLSRSADQTPHAQDAVNGTARARGRSLERAVSVAARQARVDHRRRQRHRRVHRRGVRRRRARGWPSSISWTAPSRALVSRLEGRAHRRALHSPGPYRHRGHAGGDCRPVRPTGAAWTSWSTTRPTTTGIVIADVTREYWDDRLAVNLRHYFFCAQSVLPGDEVRRQGRHRQRRLDLVAPRAYPTSSCIRPRRPASRD